MAEEIVEEGEEEVVEEVDLSEEKIDLLKKAYKRPVAGVVLETLMQFEKSLEAKEAPPEEVAEEVPSEPKTYAEYLKFYQDQQAKKAEEEQAPEDGI